MDWNAGIDRGLDDSATHRFATGAAAAAGAPLRAWGASPAAREELWRGFAALLDELAFGVMIVDADLRLAGANAAAWQVLRRRDVLRLRGVCVEAGRATDAARLRDAFSEARVGRRGYVCLGPESHRTGAAVLPVVTDDAPQVRLIALVFDREPGLSGLGAHFFARAHGITLAEERVLREIASGASVLDVAESIGCKQNTARTHVRSLLHKTGLPSLRRLVARAGAVPPLALRIGATGGTVLNHPPAARKAGDGQ